MISKMFHVEQFDFDGVPHKYSSSKNFVSEVEIPELVRVQSDTSDVVERNKEKPITFPSAALELLKNYASRFGCLNGQKINVPTYNIECFKVSGRKLSTDEIIRLAGEKFIQSCSQTAELRHPHASSFSGLSDEEAEGVKLVQFLLASAEKVGQRQFDRARELLNQCDRLSSDVGNPVQRVVTYFSEALRERIHREMGTITSKGLAMKPLLEELEEVAMSANPTVIAFFVAVPFPQVCQFTGVQTVIDNVGRAKKVHIIALEVKSGVHCTILMQALAARCECPLEHLTITAVGTRAKQKIEETGERLISFAESMNLPFSFNVVMVADMLDLNEDLFKVDSEEAVVVYSPFILWSMLTKPDRLDCLMRVIRNINPCVMVVTEVEANHNSPVFVNRFIETLFFYGAYFDSLEDCMSNEETHRMITESIFFCHAIHNIVATEGEERTVRHVSINVWRAFFARFGMVETDLSMSSLNHANMMLKNFACGNYCTLEMDGKSLMIGWKGTPMSVVSAWKFL